MSGGVGVRQDSSVYYAFKGDGTAVAGVDEDDGEVYWNRDCFPEAQYGLGLLAETVDGEGMKRCLEEASETDDHEEALDILCNEFVVRPLTEETLEKEDVDLTRTDLKRRHAYATDGADPETDYFGHERI